MKNLNHLRTCILIGMLSIMARASAQETTVPDTIHFRNGRTLVALVDEIGLDAITYHTYDNILRMAVDKVEVARVKLHTGSTLEFGHDPMDAQLPSLASSKKHVIKFDILSPAADHLVLGYEQVIRPWMNVEAKVGFIGVGISKQEDYEHSGLMLKAGIKFVSRPAIVMHGMRLNSLVSGSYVKSELIFASYTTKFIGEPDLGSGEPAPEKNGNFAFNLVFGNQHLLGGGVTVDTFFGFGFGTHWVRTDEEVNKDAGEGNPFGVLIGGSSLPIAVSGGITFGVAF